MRLLIIWTDTGQDLFLIVMGWKQSWGVAVPRGADVGLIGSHESWRQTLLQPKEMTGWQPTRKSLIKIVPLRCAIPFKPVLPPTHFYPCISAKSVPFLVRLERISPDIKWPVFLAAKMPTRNQTTYLSLKIEINGIWVTLSIDIHNLMRGWSNPKVKMLITIHCGTVRPEATQESSRPTT